MERTSSHRSRSSAGIRLACCLVVCFSTFLRGLRWWVLLRAEGPISKPAVIWASIAGQVTNIFIPGRGGDGLSAPDPARHADASKSFCLPTTLTERVMDVACLTVFGVTAMMWLEYVPQWMIAGTRVMALLAATGVAFLVRPPLVPGEADSQAGCQAAIAEALHQRLRARDSPFRRWPESALSTSESISFLLSDFANLAVLCALSLPVGGCSAFELVFPAGGALQRRAGSLPDDTHHTCWDCAVPLPCCDRPRAFWFCKESRLR